MMAGLENGRGTIVKRGGIFPACMLLAAALAAAVRSAGAASPSGNMDAIGPDLIGGWARDADFQGPIPVHIYIDGEIAHALLADGARPDLPFPDKDHGFTWRPPLLGPGSHEVVVHAIGADSSGAPDGDNPALSGSPGFISDGCTGFAQPALAWCEGVPDYYANRAADTHYLYNDNLRVGINGSFGGTVFELYAEDHSFNLLSEHGGGAVQLSVWGYEPVGPDAFFATGSGACDPTPYPTLEECMGAGHASCRLWCCSQGAHVADCRGVMSCVDWGAGAPFNPIQAQASDCGWSSPTNDVDEIVAGPGAVHVRKQAPYHFTKSDSMPGMTFEQTATLFEACVKLDYRVAYSGPYNLTPHPQEIPAVFPGPGMNHTYFFYTGPTPYTDPAGAVTTVSRPAADLMLRLKDRDPYPHSNADHYLTENWVGVCDESGSRCLTMAAFSPQYKEVNCAAYPGPGYGYMTPLGGFAITTGMDERMTIHLFPYRYDRQVAGKTVREWIFDLATVCPAQGTPCDDGDPCTLDDSCREGRCTGEPIPGCGSLDAGQGDAAVATDAAAGADAGPDGSGRRADTGALDAFGHDAAMPDAAGRPGGDPSLEGDAGFHGGRPGAPSGCGCGTAEQPAQSAGQWTLILAPAIFLAFNRRRR